MRAVVLAYHDVGCVGLQSLLEHGFDVAAVFTHHDSPHEKIWFRSVAELARSRGIPVHAPESLDEPVWIDRLRAYDPDILFSFYYRKLVGREVLQIPRLGGFNLHGSLLPRYRGRCPLNWVLLHGEHETGVTLHRMVERADAGEILAQRAIPISFDDTAPTLHRKIVDGSVRLLEQALPGIRNGTLRGRAQDLGAGSCYGRRRPEDGRIDWSRSAIEIHNLVRAVTHPFPGARTSRGAGTLYVWRARPDRDGDTSPGLPGRVRLTDGLTVETGAGRVRILSCQLDDGPELDGPAFVGESGLADGEILGGDLHSALPQPTLYSRHSR